MSRPKGNIHNSHHSNDGDDNDNENALNETIDSDSYYLVTMDNVPGTTSSTTTNGTPAPTRTTTTKTVPPTMNHRDIANPSSTRSSMMNETTPQRSGNSNRSSSRIASGTTTLNRTVSSSAISASPSNSTATAAEENRNNSSTIGSKSVIRATAKKKELQQRRRQQQRQSPSNNSNGNINTGTDSMGHPTNKIPSPPSTQQRQQQDQDEIQLPPTVKRTPLQTTSTTVSVTATSTYNGKHPNRFSNSVSSNEQSSSSTPSPSSPSIDVLQQILQMDLCVNNSNQKEMQNATRMPDATTTNEKKIEYNDTGQNNINNWNCFTTTTMTADEDGIVIPVKQEEQEQVPSYTTKRSMLNTDPPVQTQQEILTQSPPLMTMMASPSSTSSASTSREQYEQYNNYYNKIELQQQMTTQQTSNSDIGSGGIGNRNSSMKRRNAINNNSNTNNEIGLFISIGYIWRYTVRCIILCTLDHVNMLRISRILQLHVPFVSFHEAYLINRLLECIQIVYGTDSNNVNKKKVGSTSHIESKRMKYQQERQLYKVLQYAFENRNVSRLIVQVLQIRYDYIYHVPTAVRYNRYFDMIGQFPIIGSVTRFPATENFPATRNHALASIFRIVLGPGNWLTRVITRGRQGLVVDDPNHVVAQNLTAESNGLELANRNQYGTYYGRHKYTYQFRIDHRLPTDESLIRTFITVTIPTMTNNGVVHTLRTLAKHWYNIIHVQSTFGNFAHQRMELLDPFETIRIYIPTVLVTLSSLRGRNGWDSTILAPFMKLCTNLDVEMYDDDINSNLDVKQDNYKNTKHGHKDTRGIKMALSLVRELHETIIIPVSGGISTVSEPFIRWINSVEDSLYLIRKEADDVYKLVASVETGIRYGYDIISQTNWKVPSDRTLINAIHDFIAGNKNFKRNNEQANGKHGKASTLNTFVPDHLISTTLERTTPRDKRTLIELIQNNLLYTRPAQLLIKRMKTLLQREIRRDILNSTIIQLSKGDYITTINDCTLLQVNDWYWLENKKHQTDLYTYCGLQDANDKHNAKYNSKHRTKTMYRFKHVTSGKIKFLSLKNDNTFRHYSIRQYIPVAEAISQAQKVLMTIELDHLKQFSYNAFMEFHNLRVPLQRLLVVGQMTCEVLDNARLNLLREIQQSGRINQNNGRMNVEAQNVIVVGGGPGGMMVCLHCTENCLRSGGEMKLFEARDTFAKGGSTYERAQIVRLDARWIATMRYHLGTGFEDVFIPASGETDAQLGNRLALQGFVEITIKDLENILHVEVSRLWSKGLISVFTDSRSKFDPSSNALIKYGENLKVDDVVLRQLDPYGLPCHDYQLWRVIKLVYTKVLDVNEIKVNEEYGVYYRPDEIVLPFIFKSVDLSTKMYHFVSKKDGVADINVHVNDLPSIYPAGTGMNAHADIHRIVLESVKPNHHKKHHRIEMHMSCIKREKFTLDVGNTHVIEAIGKPHNSQVHFSVTTEEPHGVCCLEGLKVSLGMHNFGEKRWGSGILDDIRSLNDQNTRIIGDFTKMVRTAPIVKLMKEIMINDAEWSLHFTGLVSNSEFPQLNTIDPVVSKIVSACTWLAENAHKFRRATLQTRFFEVGDNFYLGMEFPREYNQWKTNLVDQLVIYLTTKRQFNHQSSAIDNLRQSLSHSIDRLWYFACLETIRTGDVYNPGARHRVPRLYLINSTTPQKLGMLAVGESFRLVEKPHEKYEVLVDHLLDTIVRNVEGYVSHMHKNTLVRRENNLTRCPDGNEESKVAISTFQVRHFVNHRTMRISDKDKGFVFTFAGDEQASPHFMRYSGLTGACINAMSFNNFLRKAINGVSFVERFREFAAETNWSNGEVVQRGTSNNYGQDGFLRPGFSYGECVDYLRAKVIEHMESEQNLQNLLSRDWKIKLAAALIPRGMELNRDFIKSLSQCWKEAVYERFVQSVRSDTKHYDKDIVESLLAKTDSDVLLSNNWLDTALMDTSINNELKHSIQNEHLFVARKLYDVCNDLVDFAAEASLYNERVSSEFFNQPKPVDSVVDDFAVEAQTLANSLILGAAVGSGILALNLIDQPIVYVLSILLGSAGSIIAFGTMTNVSRYKIRNEEARITFMDDKYLTLLMAVFTMMTKEQQMMVPANLNPYLRILEKKARQFRRDSVYYDYGEPTGFNRRFSLVQSDVFNVKTLKSFNVYLIDLMTNQYHVNSYVQESLVGMYKAVDEVISRLTQFDKRGQLISQSAKTESLFYRLVTFEERLERSLQRGPIRWGFVKARSFWHWDIVVVFRYFYDLLWRLFWWVGSSNSGTSCCCTLGITPIEIETSWLVHQTKTLDKLSMEGTQQYERLLSREIQDFETLFWATKESDVASMIFVSACLTFLTSLVFTVGRIFSVAAVTNLVFVSVAVSSIGALLAIFHLFRKSIILARLWIILRQKEHKIYQFIPSKDNNAIEADDKHRRKKYRNDVRLLQSVTLTQLLLTLARFVTATSAAVAFGLALVNNVIPDHTYFPKSLPFWIAMGAFLTAVGSVVFFFVVEYVIRYRLSTVLGPFICSLFQDEINECFHVMQRNSSANCGDTINKADVITWEYTARLFLHMYRFDTVFAADRFGQILQCIQSNGYMNRPVPTFENEITINSKESSERRVSI